MRLGDGHRVFRLKGFGDGYFPVPLGVDRCFQVRALEFNGRARDPGTRDNGRPLHERMNFWSSGFVLHRYHLGRGLGYRTVFLAGFTLHGMNGITRSERILHPHTPVAVCAHGCRKGFIFRVGEGNRCARHPGPIDEGVVFVRRIKPRLGTHFLGFHVLRDRFTRPLTFFGLRGGNFCPRR